MADLKDWADARSNETNNAFRDKEFGRNTIEQNMFKTKHAASFFYPTFMCKYVNLLQTIWNKLQW